MTKELKDSNLIDYNLFSSSSSMEDPTDLDEKAEVNVPFSVKKLDI